MDFISEEKNLLEHEVSLDKLTSILKEASENSGMNRTLATEARQVIPEFGNGLPLVYYTKEHSIDKYHISLEEMAKGIFDFIKKIVKALCDFFKRAYEWLFNKDSGMEAKGENVAKAEEAVKKAEDVVNKNADVMQSAEVREEVSKAVKMYSPLMVDYLCKGEYATAMRMLGAGAKHIKNSINSAVFISKQVEEVLGIIYSGGLEEDIRKSSSFKNLSNAKAFRFGMFGISSNDITLSDYRDKLSSIKDKVDSSNNEQLRADPVKLLRDSIAATQYIQADKTIKVLTECGSALKLLDGSIREIDKIVDKHPSNSIPEDIIRVAHKAFTLVRSESMAAYGILSSYNEYLKLIGDAGLLVVNTVKKAAHKCSEEAQEPKKQKFKTVSKDLSDLGSSFGR